MLDNLIGAGIEHQLMSYGSVARLEHLVLGLAYACLGHLAEMRHVFGRVFGSPLEEVFSLAADQIFSLSLGRSIVAIAEGLTALELLMQLGAMSASSLFSVGVEHLHGMC